MQRCVVHLMRDCARAASGSGSLQRRVSRIVAPVFRLEDAGAMRAACHLAIEMLEKCCRDAARILEEAEPDALAYLDFPASHWRRLRTNNVQERANRETRRRSRVVQVFPSTASPERLAGAVMCDMDEEWQEARYFSEKKIGGALRRVEGRAGGGAADARACGRVAHGGQEGHRSQPRACGRDGGGVGYGMIDGSR